MFIAETKELLFVYIMVLSPDQTISRTPGVHTSRGKGVHIDRVPSVFTWIENVEICAKWGCLLCFFVSVLRLRVVSFVYFWVRCVVFQFPCGVGQVIWLFICLFIFGAILWAYLFVLVRFSVFPDEGGQIIYLFLCFICFGAIL